jgi:low density lipoprotein receptor-related protein 5/6
MIYLLRLLFWTEWGKGAQIERCGMNGDSETRQILVSNNINWPNGLTIDYQTERLWWVDAKMARIESMNFDGTDRIIQINGTNGELGHPFSLAVFGQSIFWTDWGQKLIYRTTKKDSSRRITVVKRLQNFSPMDIKIVHPHQQLKGITLFILMTFNVFIKSPAKYYISDIMMIKSCFFVGLNPCGLNNGQCSHLCLLSPNQDQQYSCFCPTGLKLWKDKRTCTIEGII